MVINRGYSATPLSHFASQHLNFASLCECHFDWRLSAFAIGNANFLNSRIRKESRVHIRDRVVMKARWPTFHPVFVCRKTWDLFARHQSNESRRYRTHLKRMYIVLDDSFLLPLFLPRFAAVREMWRDFWKIRQSWLLPRRYRGCDQFLNGLDETENSQPIVSTLCQIGYARVEFILVALKGYYVIARAAGSRSKRIEFFFMMSGRDVHSWRGQKKITSRNQPSPSPRYVLKTNSFERDSRVEFSFGNKFVNCL